MRQLDELPEEASEADRDKVRQHSAKVQAQAMFLVSQILLAPQSPNEALAKQREDQAQHQTTQVAALHKQRDDLSAFIESLRWELADAAVLGIGRPKNASVMPPPQRLKNRRSTMI